MHRDLEECLHSRPKLLGFSWIDRAPMASAAPSRSCMSAGCASAPTSKSVVSVMTCRLRPLIFFPASKPRGPPASVVLTDWAIGDVS